MKAKFYLLIAALVVGSFSLQAQDQSTDNKQKVKVHVKITENGETKEITREVESDREVDVDSILRELGVLEGMELTSKGQQIEVDIKKKVGGVDEKDVSVHMRSPRHSARAFAMPDSEVKSKAFLGVYIESLESDEYKEKGLKDGKGAYINSVIEGTSAEKAGVMEGEIITQFDGQPVSGHSDLVDKVRAHKPGDVVGLELYKDGHFRTVSVELGEKKMERRVMIAPFDGDDENYEFNFDINGEEMHWNSEEFERYMEELGEKMEEMGEQFEWKMDEFEDHMQHGDHKYRFHFDDKAGKDRAFLGVTPGDDVEDGVEIGSVVKNSTAEAIGLQEGDVISEVNNESVGTFKDLADELREMKPGDNISVELLRDGKKMKLEGVLKSRHDTYGDDAENLFFHGEPHFIEKEVNVVIEIADITEDEAEMLNEETGIEVSPESDLAIRSLQFAPNPNNGDFQLTFDLPNTGDTEIKVYDGNGRQVYYEMLPGFQGRFENRINISDEPNGIYFLIISQKGQQFSKKIIKQ